MTDKRLQEIKDSIDFQEKVTSAYGYSMLLVTEERELYDEIIRLNKLREDVAVDILKELEENHHLSFGVALAIRQKLLDYKEINAEREENDKKEE